MKKSKAIQKVVIYGDSDFADQVYSQLESDDRYMVVAFTVDESKYEKTTFNGLPIIKFQLLKKEYSTEEVLIFPAIGYSRSNTIREIVSKEIESTGYQLMTYISKHTVIGNNAEIGKGCYICEFVSIGSNSKIGNGVMMLPNSSVAHDVVISDYSYISRSATIGGKTVIKNNTFLGLSSTIKNGIEIAEYNIIGSAANVVKSTNANGLYVGNPARRVKDVDLNNVKI
ncbi:MAG: acetyltransferase [Dysgonamonadaceae bacterium]|nr:acetyltransferase [Dysgonamonadaceae bacterium]